METLSKKEIRWDEVAPRWGDRCYPVRPSEETVAIFKQFIDSITGVVEIMGSTPEFRSILSQEKDGTTRAISAEISKQSFDAMTKLMEPEVAKREQETRRFNFVQSQWQSLPVKDQCVNFIVGDLVLNIVFNPQRGKNTSLEEHKEEQRKVLSEMKRVLTEDGKAVMRTWVLPENIKKSGQYRNIQEIFDEWEAYKKANHKEPLNTEELQDRKFIFAFFANRLIRHYQDETGKFVCSDMAELMAESKDREGNIVSFPDKVNEVMAWYWKTYTIPNWMLPKREQEELFLEHLNIEEIIETTDTLSNMNPIYVLRRSPLQKR